mmetsp:Transcript_22710/g.34344  ORF Transcript_22710/g.34344 Transcript_22710/m.34344 type:complete len:89 (-) Transcript_22710:2165-2431(-)
MRSPGEILSANTDDVRTPDTTVPFESALFARMIPSLPGGAITEILLLLVIALDRREECARFDLLVLDAPDTDPPTEPLPRPGPSSVFS